jgi:hypothetical protein
MNPILGVRFSCKTCFGKINFCFDCYTKHHYYYKQCVGHDHIKVFESVPNVYETYIKDLLKQSKTALNELYSF